MVTTQYENFVMKEGETIHEMYTRFSSITNELRCLGEHISQTKQVRKVLRALPKSWESKVDAITKAKDLKTLTMDVLIGNLQTHEINKQYDGCKKDNNKDKSLSLKSDQSDDDEEEEDKDMAYLPHMFRKIMRKHDRFRKKGSFGRNPNGVELCHRCGKPGHFIGEFSMNKAEHKKYTKPAEHPDDASMLAMKNDDEVYNTLFACMAKSDDESEDELKEKSSNIELDLEERLKDSELKLFMFLEQNAQLERDLVKLKNDLRESLKWTTSSKILDDMTSEKDNNGKGLGYEEAVSGGLWIVDTPSTWTGRTENFLSLKVLQGGSVSFGNGKQSYILGIGRIEKSLEHSIEDVYYVNGLKYNLLSVSQICDKGKEVKFLSEKCLVTNLSTNKVILTARRCKNMYVADLSSTQSDNLTCLKVQDENNDL
ncbi:uncharacterized protein LOC129884146 [Solanum dulcamara]|uniref:uncharacterized protein LOC129884146 n=1 Tax=Solanum dulcamara TaxID=45834 RepID=UPI002484EB6C|nr:uncharacterized protein LOC129884146 [Solanum dulcamara]